MSEYSKLTKKQLLDIITELQEEKSQFQEKQENDCGAVVLLKKQVNDLKEEIKDIKQKQYEKDMNRFCY